MSSFFRPSNFSQGQSPVRCWNIGTETIPAYGVMHIELCKYGPQSRQLQYNVRLFTEDDAKIQNHQRVAVNTGTALKENTKGVSTLSLPATVLIGRYGTNVIPEDFCTVGPGKNSFKLWKGGLTHTLLCVVNRAEAEADISIDPLGLVTPNTSPGGWVKIDGDLSGSDTGIATGDAELVWIDRDSDGNGGSFELSKSKDVADAESTMLVRYDHASGDVSDNDYGQIKLVSGHWALDVQYCE